MKIISALHQGIVSRLRTGMPRIYRFIYFVWTLPHTLYGIFRLKRWKINTPLKIVIGAANEYQRGWIPTQQSFFDITSEKDWEKYFEPASIDVILAEHVIEHLEPAEIKTALSFAVKYLRPGGYFRIAVPDGYFPAKNYIDQVKPGGIGPGAADHKILLNVETLSALIRDAGLTPSPLEYFDKHGDFHFTDWDPASGKIQRSKRFDKRNKDGRLNYTSLIIDALHPDS